MGFAPSLLKKKTDDRTLFFFGACCKLGRQLYTTTAPSCCIPASYCHLSATLQTTSITVVDLQGNGAEFRIFMALSMFSLDSLSLSHMNSYFPTSHQTEFSQVRTHWNTCSIPLLTRFQKTSHTVHKICIITCIVTANRTVLLHLYVHHTRRVLFTIN